MTRVLLVDDDPLVRSGLRVLLGGSPEIEIVGEAEDGDEVVAAVARLRPAVVLMDLRMRRTGGVRATELVRALPAPPAVLVLTTFDTDEDVLGALHAGAAGYLLKDTPPEDLLRAVRTVAAGDAILSPAVTRTVLAQLGDRARPEVAAQLERLSAGELRVARAVARGLSNAEIAAELHLSPATVKAYVSRALTALDLTNRVQLALLVVEAGLTAR
ncbi:response regulator transcription factor [Pseudonocardia ailaonensis]|uniref:Response regulator transcription factor n=1 Tax=Pseudonocardia ailaonensis TaxID=367279 RepID=A0ABN2MY20_9PSEU